MLGGILPSTQLLLTLRRAGKPRETASPLTEKLNVRKVVSRNAVATGDDRLMFPSLGFSPGAIHPISPCRSCPQIVTGGSAPLTRTPPGFGPDPRGACRKYTLNCVPFSQELELR